MMPPEITLFYEHNAPEDAPPLTIGTEFIILDAMKDWGKDPDEWEKKHSYEQARMMAHTHVKRSIEAYQTDWYRHKAKQEASAKEASQPSTGINR